MEKHTHDWQPTRKMRVYRCTGCKALGYRNLNGAAADTSATAIVPYKCSFHDHKTGTTCGRDSVQRIKGKNRCDQHLQHRGPGKKAAPEYLP